MVEVDTAAVAVRIPRMPYVGSVTGTGGATALVVPSCLCGGVIVLQPPELLQVGPIVLQPVGPIVGGLCPLLIVPGWWSLPDLVQVFLLQRPCRSIVIQDQTTFHYVQRGRQQLSVLVPELREVQYDRGCTGRPTDYCNYL